MEGVLTVVGKEEMAVAEVENFAPGKKNSRSAGIKFY
jgi:hypothetical protein